MEVKTETALGAIVTAKDGDRLTRQVSAVRGGNMIIRLTLVTILVRDQDEALQWFTEVLGLEKRQDAAFGKGGRWLVVAPSGQNDFGIVLQKPDPNVHGEERARERNGQIGKGTTWVF